MPQVIQLLYITALMIGVISFGLQVMTATKNLDVSNNMVKGRSTTLFFGLIVIFNFFDFLVVFFSGQIGKDSTEWIYIIENVLEVAIAYAIVCMERDYAGQRQKRWVSLFFLIMAIVILWTDMAYSANMIMMSQNAYMIIMVLLNALPLIVTAWICSGYMRRIMAEAVSKKVCVYLLMYNVFFLFLCVIVTLSIADSRTSWDFFRNDKEVYVVFWLIFNTLNALFVWTSCRTVSRENIEESVGERIDRLAYEKGLSSREKEIAMLLYKGKNNNDIASALFLSTNTVKVHTSNLYRKLGVSNRMQAVAIIRGETDDEELNV